MHHHISTRLQGLTLLLLVEIGLSFAFADDNINDGLVQNAVENEIVATPLLARNPGSILSPADSLVERLQLITSLQARFNQSLSSNTEHIQTGEFWLQKPNKFRVESGAPLSQTIVSDGLNLWTFDRDLDQVIISLLDVGAAEIPLLLFAGNPEAVVESFTVEGFAGENFSRYVLEPIQSDSLITSVTLTFENNSPTSLVIYDSLRERIQIVLSEVIVGGINVGDENVGENKADDIFFFEIPESVDVIDDRPVN